mmetsp:Transcript_15985/g.24196  ORF Transcript_15985/g.24196 Transcript_15985/m.24196 type:complete len:287 (+) Transcript_15985:213-1073(+)
MGPSVLPSQEGNDHERRRKVTRKKQPIVSHNVSTDFIIPQNFRMKYLRTYIARTLTRAMLTHLLYTRGIIPIPLSEILVFEGKVNGCKSSQVRNVRKCSRQVKDLLDHLDAIFTGSDYGHLIGAILLTIGPAWSRPREQYVLQLGCLGNDCESSISPPVQHEHTLSRKLITKLLDLSNGNIDRASQNFLHKADIAASSYQAQLSVWVPLETAKQRHRDDKVTDPSRNLVARREFSIQSKKIKRTKLLFINTLTLSAGESQPEWDESLGVWMSLPAVVKGFRAAKKS